MRIPYKRISVVSGFAILLISLIGNAWITRRQLGVQIGNQARMAESRQALFDLAEIELLLNEAESGQRGFLYTGDAKYLAPYELATAELASRIENLAQLTADRRSQQARIHALRSMVREKLSELKQTIFLYRSGKTNEAKALVLSDAGLSMMDRIRNLTHEMRQDESSLEASRSAVYLESKRVTIAYIYATNFIAAMGLIMLAYHIHREMKAREGDAQKIKAREEELRGREALLRTVTEHSHVGLTMLGADRCYLYANAAYGKLLRLGTIDFKGRRLSDVMGHVYDQISPWLDRAYAGERVNFEIMVPAIPNLGDGAVDRYYAITYEPLQTFEGPRVIGVTVDVTVRKGAEEILRLNEQRLRLAQNAARMGTFDVELPSGKRTWSRELHELFGHDGDADEPSDGELLNICHPEDRALVREQLSLVAAGKRIHVAYRIIQPNGEVRWIETAGTGVFNDAGVAIRHVGVGYDITDRKEGEDQLRRSKDQLRALSARLQSATERERLRIARELHDQLGQVLTGMKMDLDWIVRKHGADGGAWVPLVQDSMKVVDSTIGLVRRLATELRPEILDTFGLRAAIEWHTKQFQQRTGVLCVVVVAEQPLGLSEDQKIAVFRIFQEALTNISRHAAAKNVLVTLERERNDVILSIHDDGVGFVVDPLEHTHSLGILGMRERALILEAEFRLQSEPGHGTTASLRIPLEDAETAQTKAYEHTDR